MSVKGPQIHQSPRCESEVLCLPWSSKTEIELVEMVTASSPTGAKESVCVVSDETWFEPTVPHL